MLLADGGEERGFCDAWAWWARCTLGRASASRERQGKTGKRQLDRKTAQDSVAALASPCAGALCLAHTMNVGRLHKGSCHALHTQASCLSHATDKTFCSSLQQSTRPMEHRHRRSDISSETLDRSAASLVVPRHARAPRTNPAFQSTVRRRMCTPTKGIQWRESLLLLPQSARLHLAGCVSDTRTTNLLAAAHLGVLVPEPHQLASPLIRSP